VFRDREQVEHGVEISGIFLGILPLVVSGILELVVRLTFHKLLKIFLRNEN
jgi:hypothetical protein